MSFWQAKTKVKTYDKHFSRYVRIRDRKCQFGFKCIPSEQYANGELDISYLHCCHYHGRRKQSVRIDPDNAEAGCRACHLFVDSTAEGKKMFEKMMVNRLGERGHDLLQLRAETPMKMDDSMKTIIAKELLKSIDSPTK
jgi:hypothetical protein